MIYPMHQNFDLELPLKKFSLVYMLFQTAGASFWARQEDVRVPQPTKTWLHTFGLLQLTGMPHVHSIFTYYTYNKENLSQSLQAPWNASSLNSAYKDKLIYSIDSIDPELHLSLFKVARVVFLIPHQRKVAGHNSCLCGANCLRRQQGWA